MATDFHSTTLQERVDALEEQVQQTSGSEAALRAEIESYERRIESLGANMAASLAEAASGDGDTAAAGGGRGGGDGADIGELESKVRSLEEALEVARWEAQEAVAAGREQGAMWRDEKVKMQKDLTSVRDEMKVVEEEAARSQAVLSDERDALQSDLLAVRGRLAQVEEEHTVLKVLFAEVEAELAGIKVGQGASQQRDDQTVREESEREREPGEEREREWESEREREREREWEDEKTRLETRLREAEAESADSEAAVEALSLKVADLEESLEACQLDLEIAREELDEVKAKAGEVARGGGGGAAEMSMVGGRAEACVVGAGSGGAHLGCSGAGPGGADGASLEATRVAVLTDALQRVYSLHVRSVCCCGGV